MLKINCVFKLSVERIKKVIKNVEVLTNKIINSTKRQAVLCEDLCRVKNINFIQSK